jgi:hypothetical protein
MVAFCASEEEFLAASAKIMSAGDSIAESVFPEFPGAPDLVGVFCTKVVPAIPPH